MSESPLADESERVRLSKEEIAAIRVCMERHVSPLGPANLWLFGSRMDVSKRGGDIELYLDVEVGQLIFGQALKSP